MNENNVLNKTIEILNKEGSKEAYEFLISEKENIDPSSQFYNFLYCLAALSDQSEKALFFLEEAIIKKRMWYRPDVLLDDDLISIKDSERFLICKDISDARYMEAKKDATTLFTWEKKTATNLAIALHGNQQNIEVCRNDWKFLESFGYQVEYVQSSEIDSQDLFRWEDDAKVQLPFALKKIGSEEYQEHMLCGFSAGCNELLKSILEQDINCNKLILASPWIPIIEKEIEKVIKVLNEKEIEVILICGKEDEDCYSMAVELAKLIEENKGIVRTIFKENLGHEFPDDMRSVLKSIL
ncbi:MAG: hypothetical protein RBR71_10280 [Gudongella sp.]|nr:hypothetical protein [Gudongella sp.]